MRAIIESLEFVEFKNVVAGVVVCLPLVAVAAILFA